MRMRMFSVSSWAVLVLLACLQSSTTHGQFAPHAGSARRVRSAPPPTEAESCAPPAPARVPWTHSRRARFARSHGAAHHSTQGPVARSGEPVFLQGKFAYGTASKDLEGERVIAFLRLPDAPCSWRQVAEGVTNRDGRVSIEIASLSPGVYDYRLVVPGDGSDARGVVASLPEGAPIVIFDIDGTLTTDDGEVFEELLLRSEPEMQPGAPALVAHYAAAGIQPVYITGRSYHLQRRTMAWLERNHLPRGPVHTTDAVREVFPGSRVENYKLAFLNLLTGAGFEVRAAYGNASSDICAYAEAGIPADRTFIIGPNAGEACREYPASQAVAGYEQHLRALE